MRQCQERDEEKDSKPDGKSHVKYLKSLALMEEEEEALDRTKWKNYIPIPFRRPQMMGNPEEKNNLIS